MGKDDQGSQPAKPAPDKPVKAGGKSREQRRAEELRRNLLRRKAQSRDRQGPSS